MVTERVVQIGDGKNFFGSLVDGILDRSEDHVFIGHDGVRGSATHFEAETFNAQFIRPYSWACINRNSSGFSNHILPMLEKFLDYGRSVVPTRSHTTA